ncbi:acyl carrier protein [Streptomyces sp. NPDC002088]|uniref:acyl carrier protein n=1 Tax=Streptomyces sp. NPDC002088 TaxID=3154665 RepID=UPI0033173166
MDNQLSVQELAALMKKAAGVTVDATELADRLDSGFDEFGLDSLGLLGIVGELENNHGMVLPPDAERCRTPREFLDVVGSNVVAGA